MKKIIFLVSIIFAINILWANPETTLEKANSAYQNQDYQTALDNFLKVYNEGYENADLFYNIGNCYYRVGKLGNSILFLKKALKLDSTHKKAKRSLEYVLTMTKDKQQLENEEVVSKYLKNIISSISLNNLAVFVLIIITLIIFTFHIIIHKYSGKDRTVPYFFITVLIILLIPALVTSGYKLKKLNSHNEAVLTTETAIGYSGPSSDFTRVFTIHEGMILKIEKIQDDWALVQLSNGIGGWIKLDALSRI